MPMRKSKLVAIVVTVVIVTSFLAYTGLSNATEPRLYGLKVTPQSYAVNIEDSAQSNPSLMFHNFSLAGNKATFGFIFNGARETWQQGSIRSFFVILTETAQSLSWPYSVFLLKVDNVKLEVNNVSQGPVWQSQFSPWLPNATALPYSFSYVDVTQLLVGVNNVTSYNFTYSVEVTPIAEAGPYYVIGQSVWVTKSFVGPTT